MARFNDGNAFDADAMNSALQPPLPGSRGLAQALAGAFPGATVSEVDRDHGWNGGYQQIVYLVTRGQESLIVGGTRKYGDGKDMCVDYFAWPTTKAETEWFLDRIQQRPRALSTNQSQPEQAIGRPLPAAERPDGSYALPALPTRLDAG